MTAVASPIASARCSRLLERGSTDREIAAALTISVKTVEKHVGSILRKLGAQNRTQAVAARRGSASPGRDIPHRRTGDLPDAARRAARS